MTTDQYVLQTIERIRMVENNEQAETIISETLQYAREKRQQNIVSKLLEAIEQISPLECTSEQWSHLRYALMLLYKPGIPQFA